MTQRHMPFVEDDGGRAAAGFKGKTGDCVVRAVAIATGQPYAEVYRALSDGAMSERRTTTRSGRRRGRRSVRTGVDVRRKWFRDYMRGIGWTFTATMGIGTGCRVHLVEGELPMGRLVVSVSKHYTAVVDGVVRDTHDPQRTTEEYGDYDPVLKRNPIIRSSERCVYGYWSGQEVRHG